MYMRKTKRQIFDAAIKVFSNKGYIRATMDEIASSAGLVKGTLYYHFRSKEEIFNFIIKSGMEILKEEIELIAKEKENPIVKLKMLCKVQLSKVNENKDFFKVIMSQLWGQDLRQYELREAVEEYLFYMEKYLKDAMTEGFIVEGETKFMAYTFFGALCSTAVYELLNKDEENTDEVLEKLSHCILKGIEKK